MVNHMHDLIYTLCLSPTHFWHTTVFSRGAYENNSADKNSGNQCMQTVIKVSFFVHTDALVMVGEEEAN